MGLPRRMRPLHHRAAHAGLLGLSLDDIERTTFELHTLVAGDLTGTPEPAGV